MDENRALVIRDQMMNLSLQDTMALGKVLAASGYFADITTEAQAVVRILKGREIGYGPLASLTGVYIVNGKPALMAGLMAGKIRASKHYDYKILRLDSTGCEIEFYRDGQPLVPVSTFTEEDAKAAGLLASSQSYRRFPRNIYFSRALSNGARWHCPDLFDGPIYTPDELGAELDDEGNVLRIPSAPKVAEIVSAEEPLHSQPMNGDGQGERITPPQLRKLWASAKERGLRDDETEWTAKSWYGCSVGNLTRQQASVMIDALCKEDFTVPVPRGQGELTTEDGTELGIERDELMPADIDPPGHDEPCDTQIRLDIQRQWESAGHSPAQLKAWLKRAYHIERLEECTQEEAAELLANLMSAKRKDA